MGVCSSPSKFSEDSFAQLVFWFCVVQVLDYRAMNSFVLDDDEWEGLTTTRWRALSYYASKVLGMSANCLVMFYTILKWPWLLLLAMPLHIAASVYNVAEMDVNAVISVVNGGPKEMDRDVFATIIIILNCVRLFTSWLICRYWCVASGAME